jgi:hypothetical protein
MPNTSRRNVLKGLTAALAVPGSIEPPGAAQADEVDPTRGRAVLFEDHFGGLDTVIWNAGPKATTFDSGFYGRAAFARASGEEGFVPYAVVEDPRAEDGKSLQISARYMGRR